MKKVVRNAFIGLLLSGLLVGCGGGGGGGDDETATNSAPVANAGVDRNALTDSPVTLDGSQSSDPQGDFLNFFWVIVDSPEGSQATLSDPAAAKPTFTADLDGDYVLSLTVNDGELFASDEVTVTVNPANAPPTITSFTPTGGQVGTMVTVTGSNFSVATDVAFNGISASFTVVSDSGIQATVPAGATTGPISVTDSIGIGTSTDVFTVSQVLVGAGDIAACYYEEDEATAKLLDNIPGTVFTLGDNVYPDATDDEFSDCYDPTWGRHKARTRPATGNHEYHTPDASGYFNYFGAAAGDSDKGYYSYDLGEWHIIVLNSECWGWEGEVGGCDRNSPQGQWLQADLAANPSACTLAYWHHPRFSSGSHGNEPKMEDFWQLLYDAGADVVLNGHDHTYERFAPQGPNGDADLERGIRQFVVGTGGGRLNSFGTIQPNSEVRNSDTHGVLKFILHPTSYEWEFIPIAGKTFTDSGSGSCN